MSSGTNKVYSNASSVRTSQMPKGIRLKNKNKNQIPVLMIVLSVILAIITVLMVIQSIFYYSLVSKLIENKAVLGSTIQRIDLLKQKIAPQADYICSSLKSFNPSAAARSNDRTEIDKIYALYEKVDSIKVDGMELSQCLSKAMQLSFNAHLYAIEQLTSASNVDERIEPYYDLDMDEIVDQYNSKINTLIKQYDSEKDYLWKRDDPRLSEQERNNLRLEHEMNGYLDDTVDEINDSIRHGIKNGEFYLNIDRDQDFEQFISREINEYENIRNGFLITTIFVSACFVLCLFFTIKKIIKRNR